MTSARSSEIQLAARAGSATFSTGTAAAPSAGPRTRGRPGSGRGRHQGPLLRLRGDIPSGLRWGLAVIGSAALIGLWALLSTVLASDGFAVPTIAQTGRALAEMWRDGELWGDFVASLRRVGIGYTISIVLGAGLGVAMGSFASMEALLEGPVGFLRYIPASALTPLLLIWLGIDEAPKITLIVLGTVFYNVLMVADVARNVPSALINAAYTMGASRTTVLRRVILPHSWPGIIDVARINLAAAWLMLVVSELLAAEQGLAFRIIRAQRFRRLDRMFALLLVFGLLGIASDLFLRWLRNRTSPWAKA
ncbi:MAG: ABC transporter permease [Acidimicrobiales bacterium]